MEDINFKPSFHHIFIGTQSVLFSLNVTRCQISPACSTYRKLTWIIAAHTGAETQLYWSPSIIGCRKGLVESRDFTRIFTSCYFQFGCSTTFAIIVHLFLKVKFLQNYKPPIVQTNIEMQVFCNCKAISKAFNLHLLFRVVMTAHNLSCLLAIVCPV